MEAVVADAQISEGSVTTLTWKDVQEAVDRFDVLLNNTFRGQFSGRIPIYGVPTGGAIIASMLYRAAGNFRLLDDPEPGCIIVDDVYDSGRTLRPYLAAGQSCAVLVSKADDVPGLLSVVNVDRGTFVKFAWEHETGAEDAVRRLIQLMGQDPDREGLRDTPSRVCRALVEMTAGYHESAEEVLARVFESPRYDELVVVKGVRFTSMCEHHLLPFTGEATVGYLPSASGKVVGLSKLARLVQVYARRLQLQEQMTREISDAIMRHLGAKAAGVVVKAKHSCMGCRGAKQPDAEMVTSSMQGDLRTNAALRAEFLALAK